MAGSLKVTCAHGQRAWAAMSTNALTALNGATAWSIAFFYQLVSWETGAWSDIAQIGNPPVNVFIRADTMTFLAKNAGNTVSIQKDVSADTVGHHIVISGSASGDSVIYIDGFAVVTVPSLGALIASDRNVILGWDDNTHAGTLYLSDCAVWGSHSLSAGEALDLATRVHTPATLGNPATNYWTLQGTPGATATAGDLGLHDTIGSVDLDSVLIDGALTYDATEITLPPLDLLVATEAHDTQVAAAVFTPTPVAAVAAVTESHDALAGISMNPAIAADRVLLHGVFTSPTILAVTAGSDTSGLVAAFKAIATLARTEAHDTLVATSVVTAGAGLTRTERADTRSLLGITASAATVGLIGNLETPDGSAIEGHFTTIAGDAAVKVEWFYPISVGPRKPTGFHVYVGLGVPDYTIVAGTVPFSSGIANSFQAILENLADGVTYTIGVRAFNAVSEEQNTDTVTVTADSTGPLPVTSLTAVAVV